jgi:NAD(P)H-dependent FMN reductase
MDKLNIVILAGTTREKRKSIRAARFVFEMAKQYQEVEAVFVDPRDFNFPGDGNDAEGKDPKYTEITQKADGFFIVTPEYNHLIPGSLKRMLDSELKNYIHKPVAFAGVSDGLWGGVRAIEALVTTVREMGMVATFTDVQFPRVQDIFDENGKLLDEAYIKRVKRSLDELIWMAKTLKYGRENVPSQYHQKT